MDMRAAIDLISEAQLDEIERTGSVPAEQRMPDDLDQEDLTSDQLPLFQEIPTLEPKLPKGWKAVGRIGTYYVIKMADQEGAHYAVVDKGKAAAYVTLARFSRETLNYPASGASAPEINGKGLRVSFVYVRPGYTGEGLAPKLYEWILTHVCDYIMADEAHTPAGEAMWKRFVKMKDRFAVFIWDPDAYDNREIKQSRWFDRAYKHYINLPWLTLRSKVDQLLDNG